MRRNIRYLPIIMQKKFKFNRNRKNSGVQKIPFQNYNNNSIQKIRGEVMCTDIKI